MLVVSKTPSEAVEQTQLLESTASMKCLPRFISDELSYCGDYLAKVGPLPDFARHDRGLYQGSFIFEPSIQEGGVFNACYQ